MTSFAIGTPVSMGWIDVGWLARALAMQVYGADARTAAVVNRSSAPAVWLARAVGAKAVDP